MEFSNLSALSTGLPVSQRKTCNTHSTCGSNIKSRSVCKMFKRKCTSMSSPVVAAAAAAVAAEDINDGSMEELISLSKLSIGAYINRSDRTTDNAYFMAARRNRRTHQDHFLAAAAASSSLSRALPHLHRVAGLSPLLRGQRFFKRSSHPSSSCSMVRSLRASLIARDDAEEEMLTLPFKVYSSWHLPQGAAYIIRSIAAETILLDLIDHPVENGHRVSFKAIQNMVEEYPTLCTKTYPIHIGNQQEMIQELTLLSALCLLDPPLDLVQHVFRLFPQAVSIKDTTQETIPLHSACQRASLSVVSFLAQQHPDGLHVRSKDGSFPIHRASRFNPRRELIQYLIQEYPQACASCCSKGYFPLHNAVAAQAPLEVVVDLYEAYPSSAGFLNEKGRTPLHIACEAAADERVVAYLAFMAPHTLQVRDMYFHTPLFLAVRYQSLSAVKLLLEWTLRRGSRPSMDRNGRTLLHVACMRNDVHMAPQVVQLLVRRFPAMVTCRTADYDRFTPLHEVCCFNTAACLPIVQTLVSHDRRLVLLRDREGKTALHHARRNGGDAAVFEYLIEREM